jgi:hypothetical protein
MEAACFFAADERPRISNVPTKSRNTLSYFCQRQLAAGRGLFPLAAETVLKEYRAGRLKSPFPSPGP